MVKQIEADIGQTSEKDSQKIEQDSQQEYARQQLSRFKELFEKRNRFTDVLLSDPDRLSRIIDKLHTYLANITTQELVAITHSNRELQEFLVQSVFLDKEDQLYRADTDRQHTEANWSDKLMSLVGSLDGRTILTGVKNHLGDVVRTKTDVHYKAAEASEVLSIHGEYLDKKGEKPLLEVLAEVTDIVYNLTQLLALDPSEPCRMKYQKYLEQIDITYGTSRNTLLSMVVAKYHHRMYVSKNGTNAYTTEDELIGSVVAKHLPILIEDPVEAKKRINESYSVMDGIFVKLRSILLDKFIPLYASLDEQTQHILDKVLKDLIKKITAFAEIPELNPTIIQGVAGLDLESLQE